MDSEKFEAGLRRGTQAFDTAGELEGVDDPEELRLWYEAEVYALGTTPGDPDYDRGYAAGLRRAARERGLC